jgi:hypothetical protein
MEQQNLNQTPDLLVISSKKKWLWLGILVSLTNPVFAGLILGAVYLSEPALQREGKIVAAIAILWGAILFYLVNKNLTVNPFGL